MSGFVRRLSRLSYKITSFLKTSSREIRKDYMSLRYELTRLPTKTLEAIYGGIGLVATLVPIATYCAYNTAFLNRYQQWVSIKVGDRYLSLEDNLELLAIREWNTSHIARHYKLMDLIEFFMCSGTQIFSAGDLGCRTGVIVGLPHNFTYNTVDDVKLNEISVYGVNAEDLMADEEVADAFKQLIDSLVLSENAKKFAITRELHLNNNGRVIAGMLTTGVSCLLGVCLAQQIILWTKLRRRWLLSATIRLVSAAIGLFTYLIVREMCYYQWDSAADEAAVGQGDVYYEGAVEYYQKLLQKQQALKQLEDKHKVNEKTFKDLIWSLFEIKGLPINKRLENIYALKPIAPDEEHSLTQSSDSK